MQITPIGLGCWAIGGGGYESGWGEQDDQQSIATIKRALELGINWVDTAPVYGLGRSEEVVGRAIKGRDPKPYVFTKCSLVWDDRGKVSSSLKAASIRQEVENSLRRLQVDVIDLYQLHWPNPEEDIEEGWSAMARLKEEGKVRNIGVSNFNVAQMQRAMEIAPISSLQPPYSLLHRDIEQDILPFCQKRDIGVIVYSPMASGMLSGGMTRERVSNLPEDDWRKRSQEYQEPRLSRNLALTEKLNEIGYLHNRTPGEVAIAWTLRHPTVTGAIVGARRPDQIENLIGSAEFRLTDTELEEIETFLRTNP